MPIKQLVRDCKYSYVWINLRPYLISLIASLAPQEERAFIKRVAEILNLECLKHVFYIYPKLLSGTKAITPLAIGLISFSLVIGLYTLDPSNINWIYGEDPRQNFLGWNLFFNSPWSFPPGMNPRWGGEIFNSSIVYTDSIPGLAILFKLFSPWLPEVFQYFGAWLLICFLFQSVIGWKLSEIFFDNFWSKLAATILIIFSPIFLLRTGYHYALSGHFLILCALLLHFKNIGSTFLWSLLICIALSINFYLFFIIFFIFIASILDQVKADKNKKFTGLLKSLLTSLTCVFITAYLLGYFAIKFEHSSAAGFGDFQINLFSVIDPDGWSIFFKNDLFPHPSFESYGYLGLGSICILIAGGLTLFSSNQRALLTGSLKRHRFLLIFFFIFLLLALSNQMHIGNIKIYFSLPDALLKLLGIIRASGRIFWPIYYSLLLLAYFLISRFYSSRNIIVLLLFSASIQVIDTSNGWLKIRRQNISRQYIAPQFELTHPFWSQAGEKYKHITLIPFRHFHHAWDTFGTLANMHQMSTNLIYHSRIDHAKTKLAIQKGLDSFYSGNYDPDTLYILDEWRDNLWLGDPQFDPNKDLFMRVNGFNVIAPNWKECTDCLQFKQLETKLNLPPRLKLNETISFSKSGMGYQYMVGSGWGLPEKNGAWTIGGSTRLVLPAFPPDSSRLEFNVSAFINDKNPELQLTILMNDSFQLQTTIKNSHQNHLEIPLPEVVEVNKFTSIEFKFDKFISPKTLGLGDDDRNLALFIHSMTIK